MFAKTGTAEQASDPMGVNSTDTFIMLKSRDQWRSAEELQREVDALEKRQPSAHAHGEAEHAAESAEAPHQERGLAA